MRSYVVFKYEDVRRLLNDDRLTTDFPFRASRQLFGRTLLDTDGEDHHQARVALRPLLSATSVKRYRPQVIAPSVEQAIRCGSSNGLPTDLVSKFARPVPTSVMLELLGLPATHLPFVTERLRPLIDCIDGAGGRLEEAIRAGQSLERLILRLQPAAGYRRADEVHSAPGAGEALSASTMLLLLAAGTETTAAAIGMTLYLTLSCQERTHLVAARPETARDVLRESLRLYPPVHYLLRYTKERITVGNVEIPENTSVQLCIASANRDEDHFTHPEEWDLSRPQELGLEFGAGAHGCPGWNLAAAEIEMALVAFTHRYRGSQVLDFRMTGGRTIFRPAQLVVRL